MFNLCTNAQNDLTTYITLLCTAFFYFSSASDELFEKILSFFKKCLRSEIKVIYSVAIVQIIILMDKFGKNKNRFGPQLYKCLVNIFLEGYDNEEKREFFLINFEKFFNSEQQVPIDNYALCDFDFLSKIVEHPRVDSKHYPLIIKFILAVCFKNNYYNKVANYILGLILEKELIQQKCSNEDAEKIAEIFEKYINNSMNEYMKETTIIILII